MVHNSFHRSHVETIFFLGLFFTCHLPYYRGLTHAERSKPWVQAWEYSLCGVWGPHLPT